MFIQEFRGKLDTIMFDLKKIRALFRKEPELEIGTRVIVRSNEDEPYMVGTLVEYREIGRVMPIKTPVVKCEKSGKECLVFGIIEPYGEELVEALNKLTPRQQWNVLSRWHKLKKPNSSQ